MLIIDVIAVDKANPLKFKNFAKTILNITLQITTIIPTFKGVFAEFIDLVQDRCLVNPSNGAYNIFEADAALFMTRMLKEAQVDMLFYAVLTDVVCLDGKIEKINV